MIFMMVITVCIISCLEYNSAIAASTELSFSEDREEWREEGRPDSLEHTQLISIAKVGLGGGGGGGGAELVQRPLYSL